MSQIVVVEDDGANAMLIQLLLEMDGMDAVAYQTAAEAKKAITTDTRAFVIDVNLAHGHSGIDLLQQIRNGQTNAPQNSVVLMTSGDQRRETDCLQAGADGFLHKPYAPNILSQRIKHLMEERTEETI